MRALRAELLKLLKRRLLFIALAAPAITASLTIVGLHGATSPSGPGERGSPINGFSALARGSWSGLVLGLILILALAATSVSQEAALRTLKSALCRPVRRLSFLGAKVALVLALSLAVLALVGGAALLTAHLTFGLSDICDPDFPTYIYASRAEMIDHTCTALLYSLWPLCALAILGMATSTLSDEPWVCLGVVTALAVLMEAVGWLFRAPRPFLLTYHLRYPLDSLAGIAEGLSERFLDPGILHQGALLSLGIAALSAIFAGIYFQRRDVLL